MPDTTPAFEGLTQAAPSAHVAQDAGDSDDVNYAAFATAPDPTRMSIRDAMLWGTEPHPADGELGLDIAVGRWAMTQRARTTLAADATDCGAL